MSELTTQERAEIEALQLLADGANVAGVAKKMEISPEAVNDLRRSFAARHRAPGKTFANLLAVAFRNGLIK